MARPARVSPDVILAAAALEFAERGFAGARVDRIARRARVNKAMLYYHFKSKQTLYRTLLRRMFTPRRRAPAGHRRARRRARGQKIDRAIAGIAALIQEHAFFPAIMLREVAEGGAHLDRETLRRSSRAARRRRARIVAGGRRAGAFRRRQPGLRLLQHDRADRALPRRHAAAQGALQPARPRHARACPPPSSCSSSSSPPAARSRATRRRRPRRSHDDAAPTNPDAAADIPRRR